MVFKHTDTTLHYLKTTLQKNPKTLQINALVSIVPEFGAFLVLFMRDHTK